MQICGFWAEFLFTFPTTFDLIVKLSMAALHTTSGGVYQWNLKELVPRKKFASSNNDGIVSAALSPDGIYH